MYTYLTIHSKRSLPDASRFVAGNRLLIRANHALLVQSAEFREVLIFGVRMWYIPGVFTQERQ